VRRRRDGGLILRGRRRTTLGVEGARSEEQDRGGGAGRQWDSEGIRKAPMVAPSYPNPNPNPDPEPRIPNLEPAPEVLVRHLVVELDLAVLMTEPRDLGQRSACICLTSANFVCTSAPRSSVT